MKKARLTEESMSYEDLAVLENFSDDEITYELNRDIIKNRKDQRALQKAKILRSQIKNLKKFSIEGMKTIVDTISSIDDSSKKILFKHFDQSNVNILTQKAPELINNLTKIANDTQNAQFNEDINSDYLISDDSGNSSDRADCINYIEKKRKNHQTAFDDDSHYPKE
jgi:hypothetical protein